MTRQDLHWIQRLWRPFLAFLWLIIAGTLLSTLARVTLPLVLKRAFDGFEADFTESALAGAVLLYLGLGTLDWILGTGLVFLRGSMNLRFEAEARKQTYERLVRHAPGFFQRFRTGDLVTRLTDDVSEKLSWFICSGIFRAFAAVAVIVFAVAMMVRLDPLLTLFTVGPLPVLILLFIRTGTALDRRFDAVQKRISELNGDLEACFSGIRVVKAYGREGAEERSFARFASRCRLAEVDAAKSQTLIDSLFGHVWQLGVVVVLLAGGIGVMQGRLTLGTFVAFDAYVLMLIFPMFDIGTFFVRGRQSAVSIARLRELQETPPEIVESPAARAPSGVVGAHLLFEMVSYAYVRDRGAPEAGVDPGAFPSATIVHESRAMTLLPGDDRPDGAVETPALPAERPPECSSPRMIDPAGDLRPLTHAHPERAEAGAVSGGKDGSGGEDRSGGNAGSDEIIPAGGPGFPRALSEISFEIRAGEMVAIVGAVGSGKSTLLRLVPRITDPAEGRITLDGIDLRTLPLSPLRAAVGYVPQEALLFSGTIRENISFGREGIDDERVREACDTARLGRDLEQFSAGLDTLVGVRGLSLSGGQKQRVALARALAGRPRILVLDDVTAALDAETETSLWDELRRLLPDLATIVVTHRTATLQRADRILVLDLGRLVEQGTHVSLSDSGPVYQSLYRRHVLEERVGEEEPLDRVVGHTTGSAGT